jgi:hypothetical protein
VFSSTWGLSAMLDPEPSDEMLVTLAAYGLFMLNWSLLETVIEVAIAKRLELHPLEGNIVTSSLAFQSRSSILRSLLDLDTRKEAKEAQKLINTIVQEANRNAIIHGQVFVAGSHHLRFIHRKANDAISAKCIEVDSDSMRERANSLKEHIVRLQELLSISDDALHEFGLISQKLAIKSATSPKPPNSKNSEL